MKYLIVLAVVWVAILLWRKARRDEAQDAPRPAAPPAIPSPQEMLRCAHCGLHLPAADALRDAAGKPYCSAAHRQAAQA